MREQLSGVQNDNSDPYNHLVDDMMQRQRSTGSPSSDTPVSKDTGAPTSRDSHLKYVSLVTLTVQNAALILWMRYVRTRPGDMFLSTSAVVMSEVVKFMSALLIILYQERSVRKWLTYLHTNLVLDPMDSVKVAVPSLVYVLQNNLSFIALSNLDAATYQVSYQLKILTTAFFSILMLNKTVTNMQWLSLVLLMLGVAAVQMQPSTPSEDSTQNPFIGMIAVVVSCLMSGFAGVYFEKILKGSSKSVWLRNVQLGVLGTLLGLITVYVNDGKAVSQRGFFFGYDAAVWVAIMLQSLGGLIVAVVVKYADNILKGFATSAAIVISCIVSIFFFNFILSMQFVVGASLVIMSVFMYGAYTAPLLPSPPQMIMKA